jgi:hypothetical protein
MYLVQVRCVGYFLSFRTILAYYIDFPPGTKGDQDIRTMKTEHTGSGHTDRIHHTGIGPEREEVMAVITKKRQD